MKTKFLVVILFLVSQISFAQYYQERTTEHNFEFSGMFYKSHFLNPYGMKDIKQLAVGLMDDPFLNIYLNTAIMPKIENGTTKIYLDFRGDRTEEPIAINYVVPFYYDYSYSSYRMPYPDYRYISSARSEPEPIVSLGIITYPIASLNKKFYVGGTFQYIKSKDDFYSTPYTIYNNNYYYDSFGAAIKSSAESVPVVDRYSGEDEMIFTGKLFSFFSGINLIDNLCLGVFFNTVNYERTGSYLNEYNDDYGNLDNYISESKDFKSRNQNYSHFDASLGLQYNSKEIDLGLKAGYLSGNADQLHNSGSRYFYERNTPYVSEEWSHSYSTSSSKQNWDQDGNTKYISFNFLRALEKSNLKGYYKYSKTKVNSNTTSAIFDTSNYSSRYVYDYSSVHEIYLHNSTSYTKDNRIGDALRDITVNEIMIGIDWQLTENIKLQSGIYINNTVSKVNCTEDAVADQYSYYKSEGTYENENLNRVSADKQLRWNYESKYSTFQIPVILDFTISENFDLILGLTRAFQDWNITNKTDVYFRNKLVNENGVIKTEQNFIERYTSPADNYTEDFTNIFTKFNISISKQFKIGLLIDPEFEHTFRIAQWWLNFEAEI